MQSCSHLLDSIPVVGHVKSMVHYTCGDKEGANKAWTSATRGVAVSGAGMIGAAIGGPVGAAVNATFIGAYYDSMTADLTHVRHINELGGDPDSDHSSDHGWEKEQEHHLLVASVEQAERFTGVVEAIFDSMKFEGGIPFADQHDVINRCFKDFLTAAIPLMNNRTVRLAIDGDGQFRIGNLVGISRRQAVQLSIAMTRAMANARPVREHCSRRSCRFCPNLQEIQPEGDGRSGNCCETANLIYSFHCRYCDHRIVYAGRTTRPLRDRISCYLDSEGSPLRRHIATTPGHSHANDLLDVFRIVFMRSESGVDETELDDGSIQQSVGNWKGLMEWLNDE